MPTTKFKYSIVVPAYNEEEDIAETMDALLKLEGPEKEIIIVVDEGSADKTAAIVQSYQSKGVKLINQPKNMGRCDARNRGILQAQGDIVVILNADVHLPTDFLKRIDVHYANGADYVLVEAQIINIEYLYPRYIEAQHRYLYGNADWIQWTEGFSCRKQAAIDAGMFPTGFEVYLTAGEDAHFGNQLKRLGFKKVIDRSIVTRHIAPQDFGPYYRQRYGRGYSVPLIWFYLEKMSYGQVVLRLLRAIPGTLFALIFLLPIISRSFKFAKFSPYGRIDTPLLFIACYIETAASFFGECVGVISLYRDRGAVKNG